MDTSAIKSGAVAGFWRRSRTRLLILCGIAAVLVLTQSINSLSGYALNQWGLLPRTVRGLPGILSSPWLHQDWLHLAANLPVLLVLGWFAMLSSVRRFCMSSAAIILAGGILVWLFGRFAMHIGASGWVFGLWGWLLANAFFHCRIRDILIALFVFMLYGGLWFGLLPESGVSFESHIAGMLCGIAYSWREMRRTS